MFPRGNTVMGWVLMVPMACVFLEDSLPRIQLSGPVGISLVNALLLRVSALMPPSLPAVAMAAVLPVVLLCWTAARLFRGVEIPQAVPARQ